MVVTLPSLFLLFFTSTSWIQCQTLPPSCDSSIYCYGELLKTVQMNRIFPDSKTFVDMSLKSSVEQTWTNFNTMISTALNNPTKAQVTQFVHDNFVAGNELMDWVPPDFKPQPAFLNSVTVARIKEFATTLVAIWPKLSKKIKPDVAVNPEHYSLLPVPNGFVIPGGRFKEYYYWDSYFILEGLLISEMTTTAKGMLDNFLTMVDKYGFVPNGGRKYYLNRSQPPFLTLMVGLYMKYTNDRRWLQQNIHLIEKELNFWLNNRSVTVKKQGISYTMFRYNAASEGPRPESYYEDVQTAQSILDPNLKQEMYTNLKSAAESGWDFSSRWFFDPATGDADTLLEHIDTPRVIPVDLNSLLARSFQDVSGMFLTTGNVFKALPWYFRAVQLKQAIDNVMWNDEDEIWYDYDLELSKHRRHFYPSNVMPLFTKVEFPKLNLCSKVLHYLQTKANIGIYLRGVPASEIHSGEQWDFPNAWPPHQQIIVEALENLNCPKGRFLAKKLATNWVEATYLGFTNTGYMFEKYDATVVGQYGGGEEYLVQEGFGWTNGVVLSFIKKYYTET